MTPEQIKAKLASMNQKTKKNNRLWKPTDEHDVRLVAAPGNDDDPFIQKSVHYDVSSKGAVLCPRNNGDDCAVCEFAEKLTGWKDENGNDKPEDQRKSDFQIYRKIQAQSRFYVACLVRGEESEGIRFWNITEKVYKEIMTICMNPDWNDAHAEDGGGTAILFSPTTGHDIHVSLKKANDKDGKGNTKSFPLTDVEIRIKKSKLVEDKNKLKTLLENMPNIDDVAQVPSSKEVHKLWMEYISGSVDTEKVQTKPDLEHVKSNNAEKLVGKKTLDESLEELLDG